MLRGQSISRIILFYGLLFILVACSGNGTYIETFDEVGTWSAGNDLDVEGKVEGGVYDLLVKSDNLQIWSSAGRSFGDGVYEVTTTAVSGPLNNSYGMVFRLDEEQGDLYAFKISSDGFVWIGKLIESGLAENTPLIQDWWFESSAVNKGIGASNVLRVRAEADNLVFFVNDTEVGRVTDNSFRNGDIGVLAESLGLGGVQVQFDDFKVSPITDDLD